MREALQTELSASLETLEDNQKEIETKQESVSVMEAKHTSLQAELKAAFETIGEVRVCDEALRIPSPF